tara:strand:+ start:2466 stop:2768 length:303 start_codon:yes stop_codon:yes gene_type:complete
MPILIHFGKSRREGKKYVLRFENPKATIHFGSDVSTTYVEGADETTRNNYIKRHRVREDWSNINAGSASRYILWGDHKNIKKNLKDFIKRFGIHDNRKKY